MKYYIGFYRIGKKINIHDRSKMRLYETNFEKLRGRRNGHGRQLHEGNAQREVKGNHKKQKKKLLRFWESEKYGKQSKGDLFPFSSPNGFHSPL